MLQRLERMKQDSSPHGRNECALCHQEFGRLSNLPLVCRDCGRLVCSACSFELPLRDSTRARFPCDRLRKSADLGSHSMASTPTHGPDSTKTRCRHASEHGASDSLLSSDFFLAMEKTAGRRIFGASNAVALSGHNLLERIRSRRSSKQSTTFVTICKICREAREIWKMSGAWFYKTLPRSQFTSAPLTPGFNVSSPSELVGPTVSGNGPQASAEECSENTKKSAFSQRRSSHSATVSKENCTELVKSPSASLENKKNDVTTTPNSTFNQIRKVIGSESPEKVGIKSSSSEANVSSWTTPSVGTVTTLPYHPAFATPKAPSTSAASALVSSFNMANTSRKVASLTGEKSLPLITPVPPPEAPRRTNPTDEEASDMTNTNSYLPGRNIVLSTLIDQGIRFPKLIVVQRRRISKMQDTFISLLSCCPNQKYGEICAESQLLSIRATCQERSQQSRQFFYTLRIEKTRDYGD
ncbi:unnamed protein product [Calicophoron daubneyi]|uniref:FYVE-type domain-containing protein n=1 Tax=Calicophoron daubneyi TaxID=300641 RepID=A0AAV2SZL5_CALDB